MMNRNGMHLLALGLLSAASPALATIVPFTEDFVSDSAHWRDSTTLNELGWSSTGGPDGGSFAFGTFNFVNSSAGATPVLLRAQDEYGSSDHAFEGNWLADGVTEFSAYVKHDAGVPLNFFARFSNPVGFPGAVALEFVPVFSGEWTEITIAIDEDNPQWISFETADFNTIFSNIGHVQLGVSVPAELAGVDTTFQFSLDKPTVIPEPSALVLLTLGALLLRRNRGER